MGIKKYLQKINPCKISYNESVDAYRSGIIISEKIRGRKFNLLEKLGAIICEGYPRGKIICYAIDKNAN